jgi:stalled ribosome rescue protein Dom34
MTLSHVVVWIDHQEAHVIQFNAEASASEIIKTNSKHKHVHQKSGTLGAGRASIDVNFLNDVVQAVSGTNEILIVGPGSAKLELLKHAHKHAAKVSEKVVGIETVDHPTDGQLLAYAKKYFIRVDNLRAL